MAASSAEKGEPLGGVRQARWWCFTLNNYSPAELVLIRRWVDRVDKFVATYLIFQQEVGENGTPHLQGCVCFNKKMRLTEVRTLLRRAHWEVARNIDASIKYCKKDDSRLEDTTPEEFGVKRTQGERSDLNSLKRDLDNGENYDFLVENHFAHMVKHYKFVQYELFRRAEKRDFKSFVIVLHGAAGWGKTRIAHDFCKQFNLNLYMRSPGNGKNTWFDGYNPGDAIIIDDFKGQIVGTLLLQMLDRYALAVETKGGKVNFNPPVVFITSNGDWRDWYNGNKVDCRALERRIDICVKCFENRPMYFIGEGDGPWAEVACNTGGNFARLGFGQMLEGYNNVLHFLLVNANIHGIGRFEEVQDAVRELHQCGSSPATPVIIPSSP